MEKVKYNHEKTGHAEESANIVLGYFFQQLAPKSVLDVGCGNGSWLATCKKQFGVTDVFGVDGISAPTKDIADAEFLLHDLRKDLDLKRKFDVGICLEVGEHLPASAAENLVQMLTRHTDVVIFSAAIPGQGGQYHINEQWPEYWHGKFKNAGFVGYDLRDQFWDVPEVLWWYKQNMILLARPGNVKLGGFAIANKITSRVHPELYRKKIFHPKYMTSKKELARVVINAAKRFFNLLTR